MKYGYLSDEELDRADLSLPPDDPGNADYMARQKSSAESRMKLWVGCAEYRVKEWIERGFYPPGTKEAAMLSYYGSRFSVMEMNATHYRIYEESVIRKWRDTVSREDFRFLPKFPQAISHGRDAHGLTIEETTAAFLESVSAFRPHLGPLFLQMSESYGPDRQKHLYRYLASLPDEPGLTYFLELRHPQWFTDGAARQDLLTALRDLQIGLIITDTPGHREVCSMALTLPKALIRFVGRHSHPSTVRRLDAWTARLAAWENLGLTEAYFIAHTGFSAPLTAASAIRKMNEKLGTAIPEPIAGQPDPGEKSGETGIKWGT